MRPDDRAPYVGLRPFARSDTWRFFGRGYEISELSSLIVANRWVLLYAASGTGKSSLLNAGAIDELERRSGMVVLPVARLRLIADAGTRPSSTGNVFVRDMLANWNVATRAELPASSATMRRRGARRSPAGAGGPTISSSSSSAYPPLSEPAGATALVDCLRALPQPADAEGRVLIIDQFEELFVLHPERWEHREEFFGELKAALTADPLLRVVLAMREDYLAAFERHAPALGTFPWTRYRLDLLDHESALRAATEPLEATTRRFDHDAAAMLIKDLATSHVDVAGGMTATVVADCIEPVQLQLVCQRLWDRLPAEVDIITSEHVRELGSVDDVLQELFNETIESATEQFGLDPLWLRQWIEEHFVTTLGTRNSIYETPEATEGLPNAVFELLRDHQLIRTDWRAQALWHELSHDRLIEAIRQSNRLAVAAAVPESAGPSVADAYALLEQASATQLTGDFDVAKAAALEALDIFGRADDPVGVARGRYALGHAKSALGEEDSVDVLVDAAGRLREAMPEMAASAYVDAAIAAGNRDDMEQARYLAETGIALARRRDDAGAGGDALFVLGQVAQLAGDTQRSIEAFTDAVAVADRSGNAGLAAQALHRRAFVHLQPNATGGEEGALADLAAAAEHAQEINDPIERNRLRSAILVDVARVHLERGRLDEAIRATSAAIAADRASSEAYELRAGAQWEQGQLEAAVADYDRALALSSSSISVRTQRAQVLVEVGGRNEEALRELDSVIAEFDAVDPDDPLAAYARRSRAAVLASMGQLDAALSEATNSLELQPGNAWAYYTRGNVRLQAGDAVGALSDFVASTVHDDPPLPARLASQASELRASLAPETRA